MNEMPAQFWQAFFGEEHGAVIGMAIQVIGDADPEIFEDTLRELGFESSVGPMLNPTAYMGGARFDNAREMKKLVEATRKLNQAERSRRENWRGDAPQVSD